MAITQTYLAADLGANDITMAVNSGNGFPAVGTISNPGYLVRIDTEFFYAVAQPVAGTITLKRRGSHGGVARAHDVLSKVEVSALPSDFTNPSPGNDVSIPPYTPVQTTIGENRTFTSAEILAWGNQEQVLAITKASAATIVLVAPSTAQDGLIVRITSLTPYLHVITATALLANGATASPYTTATGADTKIGATITLQAQNALWNVVSNVGFGLS